MLCSLRFSGTCCLQVVIGRPWWKILAFSRIQRILARSTVNPQLHVVREYQDDRKFGSKSPEDLTSSSTHRSASSNEAVKGWESWLGLTHDSSLVLRGQTWSLKIMFYPYFTLITDPMANVAIDRVTWSFTLPRPRVFVFCDLLPGPPGTPSMYSISRPLQLITTGPC